MKITIEYNGTTVVKDIDPHILNAVLKTATSTAALLRYMLIEAGLDIEDQYSSKFPGYFQIDGVAYKRVSSRPPETQEVEEDDDWMIDPLEDARGYVVKKRPPTEDRNF